MVKLQIIYWRDIPAQVIVSQGREKVRRQLSARFETAIDTAAMRAGLRGTDDYLAHWRRTTPTPVDEDMEIAAENARAILEETYTDARLERLVRDFGIEEAEPEVDSEAHVSKAVAI